MDRHLAISLRGTSTKDPPPLTRTSRLRHPKNRKKLKIRVKTKKEESKSEREHDGRIRATIPAWVRKYSDEEAYMQLMLSNVQSGLRPLERGRHAHLATTKYGKNGTNSVAQYAAQLNRKEQTVRDEVHAWEVAESTDIGGIVDLANPRTAGDSLENYFSQLVAIHAAPPECWVELCKRMLDENWTVQQTKRAVQELRPQKTKKKKPGITAITLKDWKEMSQLERERALDWRERDYRLRRPVCRAPQSEGTDRSKRDLGLGGR
jgi:hypothetical protein